MDITELLIQESAMSLIYSRSRENNTRFIVPTVLNIALGKDSSGIKRRAETPVLFNSLVDFKITVLKLSTAMKKSNRAFNNSSLRFSQYPLLLPENKNVDSFITNCKELGFAQGLLLVNTLNTACHYLGSKTYSIESYLPQVIRNLLIIREKLKCSIGLVMTGNKVSPDLAEQMTNIIRVSNEGHEIEKGDNQVSVYKLMTK
jgi:hypothetical protein